jgi:hypothetical protein
MIAPDVDHLQNGGYVSRIRISLLRAVTVAAAVTTGLATLTAPAVAGGASASPVGQLTGGYQISVIDPETGQEVVQDVTNFDFEYEVAGGLTPTRGTDAFANCLKSLPTGSPGLDSANPQPDACGELPRRPPQPPPGTPPGAPQPPPTGSVYCQTFWTAYKIFIRFGPTLLEWKFSFRRCWDGTNVRQPATTEALYVYSPAMRVSGSRIKFVGPAPAPVVTMRHEGLEFTYCPVVAMLGVQCIAAFHPRVEFIFTGNGGWLNQSFI